MPSAILISLLVIAAAVYATRTDDQGNRRRLGAEASPLEAIRDAYVSTYEVVTKWPHDSNAFTQGLAFDHTGNLYESDGLYRESQVRHVDAVTGHSKARTSNPSNVRNIPHTISESRCLSLPRDDVCFLRCDLPLWTQRVLLTSVIVVCAQHFGEGIAIVGDRMLQLTWKEKAVHEFQLPSLTHLSQRTLPCAIASGKDRCHEGWGLAYGTIASGSHRLFLTDSTDRLFTLDPQSLQSTKAPMTIYDHRIGRPIHGVNELEWVDGELWGNIYPMYQGTASECVVRINATDASVLGWIDFRGLLERQRQTVRAQPHNYVLNGIAYHEPSARLYVTGKKWDQMYHVRVKPEERTHQSSAHVESICQLGARDGSRHG